MFYSQYRSPIGLLTLVSNGEALTELRMDTQKVPLEQFSQQDALPLFSCVRNWLDAYFSGAPEPVSFPLSPAGSPFRKQVWDILLQIPWGQTVTYGEIAREISPTMSAQAVGQAVGSNPIGIIIPCHRVVGAGGKLTGYAGGMEKKIWLLKHEEESK